MLPRFACNLVGTHTSAAIVAFHIRTPARLGCVMMLSVRFRSGARNARPPMLHILLITLMIFAAATIAGVVLQVRAEHSEVSSSRVLCTEAVGVVLCILLAVALVYECHWEQGSKSPSSCSRFSASPADSFFSPCRFLSASRTQSGQNIRHSHYLRLHRGLRISHLARLRLPSRPALLIQALEAKRSQR